VTEQKHWIAATQSGKHCWGYLLKGPYKMATNKNLAMAILRKTMHFGNTVNDESSAPSTETDTEMTLDCGDAIQT
jgi:hypothetical protein